MNLYKRHTAGTPGMTAYPGKAGETIVSGEALVLSAGALTKCGATEKPQFIAMSSGTDTNIYVLPVEDGDTYKAQFSVSAAALKVGDKVTLDATGTKVTATTTDGVATIKEIFGTAAGDTCAVSF